MPLRNLGELAFAEQPVTTKEEPLPMQQLRKGWEIPVTVRYYDDQGDDAEVEGQPAWTAEDETILAFEDWDVTTDGPAPTIGFVKWIQGIGSVGATSKFRITADADLGSGVEEVIVEDTIQIVSGQATSGSVAYGDAREIVQ
jgi:hypothetical protein